MAAKTKYRGIQISKPIKNKGKIKKKLNERYNLQKL
jgi:hypothetical protein